MMFRIYQTLKVRLPLTTLHLFLQKINKFLFIITNREEKSEMREKKGDEQTVAPRGEEIDEFDPSLAPVCKRSF